MLFLCPKCKKELNIIDNACRCAEGHSYDRAKGGYYNLLLGSAGGTHGDNREMVEARRDFLNRGYYRPLAEKLSSLVLDCTPKCGAVLDAGCGEGYYTAMVESALRARDTESYVSGFDISKEAVKRAAKACSNITYAVAGSYHMPVGDEAVDTLFNVFSPLAIDETRRVIKPGGHFIMVIPDEEHLFELKQAIYDTPYKNTVEDTHIPGFSLVWRVDVKYTMKLDTPEAISSLFMMTPYAYRTRPENRERIKGLRELECRAEFIVFVYEKEK